MRFTVSRDIEKDLYRATLEIEAGDMLNVELSQTDRALLRECEQSGSISDKLLALETITRRIEETYAKEASQGK